MRANLAFARTHVDWPYIQHPTPYPRTPMTREFEERGLMVSESPEDYDGTTAVVRSQHLAAEELRVVVGGGRLRLLRPAGPGQEVHGGRAGRLQHGRREPDGARQ